MQEMPLYCSVWCLAQLYGDKKDDTIVLELLDKVCVCNAILVFHVSCLQPKCKFGKIVCMLCNTPICTLHSAHIYTSNVYVCMHLYF